MLYLDVVMRSGNAQAGSSFERASSGVIQLSDQGFQVYVHIDYLVMGRGPAANRTTTIVDQPSGCKRPPTPLSTIGTTATPQAAANSGMIYESVTSSDPVRY